MCPYGIAGSGVHGWLEVGLLVLLLWRLALRGLGRVAARLVHGRLLGVGPAGCSTSSPAEEEDETQGE
jgi:hypothetical protein